MTSRRAPVSSLVLVSATWSSRWGGPGGPGAASVVSRRPIGGGGARRRVPDELPEPGQPALPDDAVRRAVRPRPHEQTGYAGPGQRGTDGRPGRVVTPTQGQRIHGRAGSAVPEAPPAQPGAVERPSAGRHLDR